MGPGTATPSRSLHRHHARRQQARPRGVTENTERDGRAVRTGGGTAVHGGEREERGRSSGFVHGDWYVLGTLMMYWTDHGHIARKLPLAPPPQRTAAAGSKGMKVSGETQEARSACNC